VDSLLIVVLFLLGVSGFLTYCRALISVGPLVRGFLTYCRALISVGPLVRGFLTYCRIILVRCQDSFVLIPVLFLLGVSGFSCQ
jgi:hypothetical protein